MKNCRKTSSDARQLILKPRSNQMVSGLQLKLDRVRHKISWISCLSVGHSPPSSLSEILKTYDIILHFDEALWAKATRF